MNSRMTYLDEEQGLLDFAKNAAKHFAEHEKIYTFGDLTPGSFIALRWGLGEDCVIVFKLDAEWQPINFQNAIKEFRPSVEEMIENVL